MKQNRHNAPHRPLLILLTLTLALASCGSVEKFIQPDQRILNSNNYQVSMPDGSAPPKEIRDALSDMKKYTRQKPNSHILGVGPRFTMHVYCLSNPDKSNFWHNYLRRKGQAPVIYDENATIQTCNQIAGLLQSKGCFNSTVTFDTVHSRKHDINVNYHIHPSQRYRIDDISFRAETPDVDKLLKQWKDQSLLKEGDYYDQDLMDAERKRITEQLRNEGYYHASTDLLSYTVDTAFQDNKLTIRLNIRDPRFINANKQTVTQPLQKYYLDNIYIYPNSSTAQQLGASTAYDTLTLPMHFRTRTSNYHFIHNQPLSIKPSTISRSLFLFEGLTYRPRNIERTYNSLLSLRNFKYINIEFVESPNSNDTNRLLNARVRLLNAKRQRLSASVEINNSSPFGQESQGLMSGNLGLETKISYQNKNLFHGAEQFKAEWSLLVELPKLILKSRDSENLRNNVSNFENGINLSLDLPTFLFPFTKDILWQQMRPHTLVTLGGNYQLHSYFERLLFNSGFGYSSATSCCPSS